MNKLPVNLDLGMLVIRLMVGVIGFYHGSQKLFSMFGGPGLKGFSGMLEGMNVPLPQVSAALAGGAEFFGGILIALGLVSRIGAFFLAFTMAVAVGMVHWKNGFSGQGGFEYPLLILVICLGIMIGGPGKYAITQKV
jgi:putative oxidoreductase